MGILNSNSTIDLLTRMVSDHDLDVVVHMGNISPLDDMFDRCQVTLVTQMIDSQSSTKQHGTFFSIKLRMSPNEFPTWSARYTVSINRNH